jgi:integrase
LKRSFNIAEIPFPKIEKLKENNVRKGFVENDRFWFFYGHLPEHLKALAIFAYETGCRCSEIISLRWKQLDWQSGFVRLNPGETKNDEGRVIPLSGMTMFMLNRLPKVSDFLFTYKNKPLRNFKTGWAAACKAAGKGYEHFLFHDLRRSAVRNMVRGGTPERVAMAVSGHKTRSVFDRYNIVDEKDLQAAMKDMDALRLRDLIYDPKRSPEIDQFFQRKKELEELKKSAAKGT